MLFTIEGNIGSGKSTILQTLKQTTSDINGIPVIFVDEPVRTWEQIVDKNGTNMIELFYGNPKKYAFAFQMMAFISRYTILNNAIIQHPNSIILTERCLLTDYNIFANLLHEKGDMLDEEFAIYKRWFNYFNQDIVLSGIIYIKCAPEISHARCVRRNRVGENIPLEYLQQCHEKHEVWVDNEQSCCNTIVIDNGVNDGLDADELSDLTQRVNDIVDFISDEVYEHFEYNEFTEAIRVIHQQSTYLSMMFRDFKSLIFSQINTINLYVESRIGGYLN